MLWALLAFAPTAWAQEFPKLTGRVVDAANLLDPPREQALTEKLAALEKQSGRQLVVVTVPSLQDYDIADYGYRLGRAWGIGEKDKNTGALLIVAPTERKVRIEVGYGLEGILTDALSSRIIRDNVVPRFKANDYPGGLEAGANAISTLLTLPPDEARAQAVEAEKAAQGSDSGGNGFMLIFWIAILLFFVVPMLFGRRGG
ncbi:MAG: TPM domain-containing protein, partial [Sphingobium sp.]